MDKLKVKAVSTDILGITEKIVERYVMHFKSDFDIDRETQSGNRRTAYLWLVRECGTWLLSERNLFIKGTREHCTRAYYVEQERDGVVLISVEATGTSDTRGLSGSIYRLPGLAGYYGHILSNAVPPRSITLQYERGRRSIDPDKRFGGYSDSEYGKFVSLQYEPQSEG